MDIFVGVIVGLLVLMVLVILHEFGHFLAARRNGVNVLEFGIGFPPRAIAWVKDPRTGKWRRLPRSEWEKDRLSKVVFSSSKDDGGLAQKGMIFSLNFLPIGGFCQMDGESAADTRKGTFGAASFWAKTKILFAGVTMNWLAAMVILTILAWTGMPDFIEGQFTVPSDTRVDFTPVQILTVAEGSPADLAGIEPGDYVVSIDGNEIRYGGDITTYNTAHAGEEVTYKLRRELEVIDKVCEEDCVDCECTGTSAAVQEVDTVVKLNPADAEYLLGVTMETSQAKSYSTWSAPIVGVGVTLQMTGQTFQGLGELVWNLISGVGRLFSLDAGVRESGQAAISAVGDSVSGPVGIIGVLFPAFTAAGPSNLAYLAAIISISLACMNVLPIPALDGGRWLLIAIYKLRKKTLTKETEEKIVARAFVTLLILMLIVTILDITRLF